jgi:LCP family protein required for cell wall assembly
MPQRPWYQRWRVVVPVALVAILLTSMAAGAWYINDKLNGLHEVSTPPPEVSVTDTDSGNARVVIDTSAAREHVQQLEANNPAAADPLDDHIAVLVMGVDARPGEPIDVKVRADSLSVVMLDREDGSCRMLSIPRDTRIELPGYGRSKINSALSIGGIPYQQLVVENLLGIEIDHYALIDFSGVEQLVDAIGRVIVTNDQAFSIDGIDYPTGSLALNGHEALMYARYRGGPDGDFGRQERQQQVARALLSRGAGLEVVTAVPELLSAVEGHVRTDLGPKQMIDLGQEFHDSCTADSLDVAHLDGNIADAYDDIMEQDLSLVHITEVEIQRKVAWLRE